jgi:hypothetical protein
VYKIAKRAREEREFPEETPHPPPLVGGCSRKK